MTLEQTIIEKDLDIESLNRSIANMDSMVEKLKNLREIEQEHSELKEAHLELQGNFKELE